MGEINISSLRINHLCTLDTWINDDIIFINDIHVVDHEGKLSENFILKKLSLKTNWISEFTRLNFCLKKSIPQKLAL